MTMRTTSKTVTFHRPFRLQGVDHVLPPADYRVMTDEETHRGSVLFGLPSGFDGHLRAGAVWFCGRDGDD